MSSNVSKLVNLYKENINQKDFFSQVGIFIILTIVGCLSHEFGHYIVARMLGYHSKIHYSFTSWVNLKSYNFIKNTYAAYREEIKKGKIFPLKDYFDKIRIEQSKDNFLILLGGPLQTMLTASLSFLLLIVLTKIKYFKAKRKGLRSLLIYSSLLWLRQLLNGIIWITSYFIFGTFSKSSDEVKISLRFHC